MDPVLLQKQLRENANDLQEFCKDLQNWGDEMKRKEESLDKNSKNEQQTKVLKTETTEKSNKKTKKSLSSNKRGGPTDYNKWEKFDADLECERMEDDIDDDSELTDENDLMLRDQALEAKEKGNQYVKKQQWDKAIESYTKAIECYSYDPIFYANRALCYLKIGNFTKAESDCNLSLKLDSTYVKAYQRRAAARESLNRLQQAKEDILKVLELEPKNTESSKALEKINKKLGQSVSEHEKNVEQQQRPVSKFTASRNKTKPSSSTSINPIISSLNELEPSKSIDTSHPVSVWPKETEEIITVKPINKPIHKRSKKPLKRIEIVEVDSSINVEEPKIVEPPSKIENVPVKKHVVEKVEKKVRIVEPSTDISEKSPKITDIEKPPKIQSAFKKERISKNVEENTLNETAWPKPDNNPSLIRCDDLKVLERKNTENVSKTNKNMSNLIISKDSIDVPKTSIQFFSAWKRFKTLEEKYNYLRVIDPHEIPNIFKESLDSNIFSEILLVLAEQFIDNKNPVYDMLYNFTKVKRFSAIAMFLEYVDKKCLWKLFDYVKDQEGKTKEDVDFLIKSYEL